MPNSLKNQLKKLGYEDKITEEELNELLDKLEGHDRELTNQTGWIPVSERLPEDFGGDYLVNIEYKGEHEGIDIATYIIGGYLDGLWDTPNDWIEGSSEYWHVTAWMPLPEPYKKEGDNNE